MKEYVIKLNNELEKELITQSKQRGISIEEYLQSIVKLFVSSLHNIDQDSMEKGYREMGAINLKLADIGDNPDGKVDEHKKRVDILCGPKSGGGK